MTAAADRALVPESTTPEKNVAPVEQLSVQEMAGALRALPHGGSDDSTRSFELPPQVRAAVSPVINALRWGAVLFGMVFAAPRATVEGEMQQVIALSVALFLATWRTVQPNRLASPRPLDRMLIHTDMAVLSVASGLGGGFNSPFVFCVMAVAVIGAFGWGIATGASLIALGTSGLLIGGLFTARASNGDSFSILPHLSEQSTQVVLVSMIVAAGLAAFARLRLLESERRRITLKNQLDSMNEANDLLQMLNTMARSLPNSLNLRDATEAARDQLRTSFSPDVVCLLVLDEGSGEWVPQITDGCVVRPTTTDDELPTALQRALESKRPVIERFAKGSTEMVDPDSRVGLYTPLRARNQVIGLLAVEHRDGESWSDRDRQVLAGLSDLLAISIDNARWFGRLRSLGADEERTRIARDLHDRLGQWLTYINFELERIISSEDSAENELFSLHSDVQSAIDELRETLRQLRSGVSEEQRLEDVAREHIARFADRTKTKVTFEVTHPGEHLTVPVENELLRILQESLNNVDKHAKAESVTVRWSVNDGAGSLTIEDDGRGFDTTGGVRESAYGLVGMRERADVAGVRLDIDSERGRGTKITVTTGNDTKETRR